MKFDENISKKFYANLFLCCLIGIITLSAGQLISAQTNLRKAIDSYIEKVREDAEENRESRKVIYGDVNGDGTKDAVVQYTLEGAGGGNSWGQNLVVFLNKKGVYKASADESVGGKFFRSFDLLKVVSKEIIGATETCPEDEPQGLCENPAKKQVKFVLQNGKLKEK
jgi:hypothetical protein